MAPHDDPDRADAVVVGAGFGGLGAALRLAEAGARVIVLERAPYPGGCAATFSRAGYRFEAGATLCSGFGPGQLFRTWIDRHGLDVRVDPLDPVVTFRAPGLELAVPSDRSAYAARLAALPGADPAAVHSFLARQRRVADLLWHLLDDPALLPPFGRGGLLAHLRRLPRYLPLVALAGRPLASVLRAHGLDRCAPLRLFLDGVCQITLQCTASEAEAPFALGTLDYWFRGTGHVRGGIGAFAEALVGALRTLGADVRLGDGALAVRRDGGEAGDWVVRTRRGVVRAPRLLLNVLPQNAAALLGEEARAARDLDTLAADVEGGWGACMLYRVVRVAGPGAEGAQHVAIWQDPAAPPVDGNHLFCSVGAPRDEAPGDATPADRRLRSVTVSTHVPMRRLLALAGAERADHVRSIQDRMRAGLERFAPQWATDVVHEMTASPRTFERFTGRHLGYVGGVPRRASLRHYRHLGPREILPGVWLVGDSVFPGQSTLATALCGVKAAEAASGHTSVRLS